MFESEVELLPDFEVDVPDLALVPVLAFDLVEEALELLPVVEVLLVLPDVEEADGEEDEPDLDDDPELPVLPLKFVLLLPICDELEEPDVLPDMEPEPWFFSLSFIV